MTRFVLLLVTTCLLYGGDFDLHRFNKLLQHDATIDMIRAGNGYKDIIHSWESSRLAFLKRREAHLLYLP